MASGLQAWKVEVRKRGRKVIACTFREIQESLSENDANGVDPSIIVPRLTAAIAVKACDWVMTAGLDGLAQHIQLLP